MTPMKLDFSDKQEIQKVVEGLEAAQDRDVDWFLDQLPRGNRSALSRFIGGAYNHPITWWIGVFQLQMQMGIWGHRWQSAASLRSNELWVATKPLHPNVAATVQRHGSATLETVVRYNLKYRKADILGRFAGAQFTNYASTGGRYGARRIGAAGKLMRAPTNFALATYGAMIQAIANGHRRLEQLLQAALTGHPSDFPSHYQGASQQEHPEEAAQIGKLQSLVIEVAELTRLTPRPVSIKDFCARPENMKLRGVCR